MFRRFRRLILIPLLLAIALPGVPWVPAEEGYVGDETCAACHEDVVQAFQRTAHASAAGWDSERGCESCHGPGEAHVDAEGDATKIRRLGELAPREASDVCLACHQRQEKLSSFKRSIHRLGEVGCQDCHDPHSTAERLLPRKGADLCSTCHQGIAAQFDLPRSHPIEDCSKCHPPHATRSLRVDSALFKNICTDCHFEKEGPFVFEHDVVTVDGCVACHEVHGSPNRHLLKHEPQVNLCYQCHSATVTPGWHSAPRFLNEKCTACHTAIHGSNTNTFFLEE